MKWSTRLALVVPCLSFLVAGIATAQESGRTATAAALPGYLFSQAPATGDATRAPEAEKQLWQPSAFFQSLTWGGFIETSYTFNFESPKAGNENVGRAFDTNSNEFMLNAVVLKVGRGVNKDQWVGFQVDALAGQDAPTGQAIGLFKGTDGVSQTSFDLVNAHILFFCPETHTQVKVGKFLTPAGAEGFYSPDQWNFSRSFLWTFAIPISHTGIEVRQPLLRREDGETELLAFAVGATNGWDNVKDLNEEKMFYGSATFSPADQFSLTTNFLYSFSEQATNAENARQLLDIAGTVKPFLGSDSSLDAFQFGFNLDVGGEEGASTENNGYGSWWGFALMTKFDFALFGSGDPKTESKDWYLAARGEYMNDPDAARTGSLTDPALANTTGLNLWEFTVTLGWRPWPNVLFRSELRHDRADSNVFPDKADAQDHSYQTTLAFVADFIF